MKREELIAYDKWLTRRKWGTGEIISPEKAADLYLAEHPLPPAEGATAEEFLKGCEHDGSFIPVHEVIRLMNAFAASQKQQPTAEGAEEILDKYPHSTEYPSFIHENSAIAAMHEFAILHAQQVAEKMVEDMRQKLFSMRSTKEAMYKLSEADRLMQYGYHDCINEMLMWTKKLSHD